MATTAKDLMVDDEVMAVVAFLRRQEWSDFAMSLVDFFDQRNFLSEKQMAAAKSMKAKIDARDQEKAAAVVMPLPGETALPIGTFTLHRSDGSHRTFQTRLQSADASFAPGKVVISFLSGSDNESNFTGFGFVTGTPDDPKVNVWSRFVNNEILAEDVAELLKGGDDVLVAKHCIACGRTLTRPSSIHANIGPECAKKFGGAA